MKQIFKTWLMVAIYGFPVFVFAEGKTLRDIAVMFTGYLQVALTLIISFAIVTFVWNVYRYFFTSDVSGDQKKEAGLYVFYSVVGFFVIFSFWGLVAILKNTFNLPDYRPGWPFGGSSSYSTSPSGGSVFGNTQTSGGGQVYGNTQTSGGGQNYTNTSTSGGGLPYSSSDPYYGGSASGESESESVFSGGYTPDTSGGLKQSPPQR